WAAHPHRGAHVPDVRAVAAVETMTDQLQAGRGERTPQGGVTGARGELVHDPVPELPGLGEAEPGDRHAVRRAADRDEVRRVVGRARVGVDAAVVPQRARAL